MKKDFDILTDAEIDELAARLDDSFRPRLPGKLGKLVAQALEDADGPTLRFLLRTIAKHKRRVANRPTTREPEPVAPKPVKPARPTKPAKPTENVAPPAVETPESVETPE